VDEACRRSGAGRLCRDLRAARLGELFKDLSDLRRAWASRRRLRGAGQGRLPSRHFASAAREDVDGRDGPASPERPAGYGVDRFRPAQCCGVQRAVRARPPVPLCRQRRGAASLPGPLRQRADRHSPRRPHRQLGGRVARSAGARHRARVVHPRAEHRRTCDAGHERRRRLVSVFRGRLLSLARVARPQRLP
jgi:hypothetical protein